MNLLRKNDALLDIPISAPFIDCISMLVWKLYVYLKFIIVSINTTWLSNQPFFHRHGFYLSSYEMTVCISSSRGQQETEIYYTAHLYINAFCYFYDTVYLLNSGCKTLYLSFHVSVSTYPSKYDKINKINVFYDLRRMSGARQICLQ